MYTEKGLYQQDASSSLSNYGHFVLLRPSLTLTPYLSPRYSDLQWASTGLALHGVFQLAPRSPGGRVVALGASFVAVIVISMYIAAYSAQITVHNLKPQVSSITDLNNAPVGIWEVSVLPSSTPCLDLNPLLGPQPLGPLAVYEHSTWSMHPAHDDETAKT